MAQEHSYIDLPIEQVMGDRFGRYSKYIIQDRALPDVRDGLKPVQRRILYAMHVDKNTHDKNFRKAAKTVGTVIGNYHPHGDSSVYEAMVRLSQDWKMRYDLIEMHGNNGSIDGDPPAAMRYTEARLAQITSELLRDIDKDTVEFVENFDDTNEEPTVFPAKLPNLLINGSTGISAGYATNIPPHNLNEVIDAVIMKIDKKHVTVDDLLTVIKGPDFPTGGIVQGLDGIKQAFETGKGRVIVRGKVSIDKMKGNRQQIVITEIPYDVNKANLVRKMDELAYDRKVEGIAEVRDETDRNGLRIVIDLRKDADSEGILNFLYKNTDLQVMYHYNMVAIQDKTPKQLSLPAILDAYIAHQIDVVTRRTTYDLNKASSRVHIVDGLIKAISVLDELIQTIRHSENRADAKVNIMTKYEFTDEQAEAILNLQLYRLTNTDITQLTAEKETLEKNIAIYEGILSNKKTLMSVIKKELRELKKSYSSERRSVIEAEIETIKINIEVTVPSEDVIVSMTNEGYIKRTSTRSYAASNGEDIGIKENDYVIRCFDINTTEHIVLLTNLGRYVSIPVHELPDVRWKDLGQHISNIATLEKDEHVIQCIPVDDFSKGHLLFFTKQGMVKRTKLSLYETNRTSRALIAINLRENDEVMQAHHTLQPQHIFIATKKGYGLWFKDEEISEVGVRALGVIGINLKDDDELVSGNIFDPETNPTLFLVTHRGACKRMNLSKFDCTSRARRGVIMLRELKTKSHTVKKFFVLTDHPVVYLQTEKNKKVKIHALELPVSERNSNGSFVVDIDHDGKLTNIWHEAQYEQK